ncbi:MAG: hypothetical protein LUG18_00405 [Candidatus Azobacteroides sp.]|nr:hypothetical protein [Candidatus Azobacteroides sp.]
MKKSIPYIFTVIFVALSFFVSANNHTFDSLTEVLYSYYKLTPEALIMDPVYDQDNRIIRYTMGNMIKAEYLPIGSEYPEQKIVSVWNSANMDWMPVSKEIYAYNTEGRISEKTTYKQAAYHSFEFSLQPAYTSRYLYTREKNKEIIREISEQHAVYDTIITTCYLNKNGQPDSIIYSDDNKTCIKMDYTYNREKRPVYLEGYYKVGNNEYVTIFHIEIEYKKNGLVYKYFSNPAFNIHIGDETEGFPDNSHEAIPDEQQATISIRLDNKKRIISKEFIFEKSPVLNTRYTYDSKGRQYVDATYTTFPAQMLPCKDLSGYGAIGDISYSVSYDKEDFRVMDIFTKDPQEEEKRQPLVVMKDKTTPEGNTLYHESIRYREEDGEFENKALAVFTYSTGKNGISRKEKEHYLITEEEDDIMRNGYNKEVLETDSQGRILLKQTYFYDDDLNKWIDENIQKTSYDENGYKASEETLSYDRANNKWKGQVSYVWLRDKEGRMLSEKKMKWEDGEWIDDYCNTYAYDLHGNKTLEEKMEYQSYLQEWKGEYKVVTAYDDESRLVSIINYIWESYYNEWIPWKKKEYSYEEYSKEEADYIWENDTWLPKRKEYEYQNQIPFPENIYKLWNWNKEKGEWQISVVRNKRQPAENTFEQQEYRWNDKLGKPEGEEYIIHSVIGDSIRKIYHAWDSSKDEWQPRLQYTELTFLRVEEESCDTLTYLFRRYDPATTQWINDRMVFIRTEFDEKDIRGNIIINRYSELYEWDSGSQTWKAKQSVFSNENKYGSKKYYAEHSIYDPVSGNKIPLYFYKWDKDKKEGIYSVRDKKTNSFQPFYKEAEKGAWNNHIFLWDNLSESWVDNEEYRKTNPQKRKKALDYINSTLNGYLFYINITPMIYEYLK